MTHLKNLLLISMMIVALVACGGEQVEPIENPGTGSEGDSDQTSGQAYIDSVDISLMESFPLQASALVSGSLSDGCTEIDSIEQSREGNTITLIVNTTRPEDAVCTEALVPFDEDIDLDIEGLEAGTYTVVAGEAETTFTLEEDNSAVQPEPGNTISFEDVEANPDGTLVITGELSDSCIEYITHNEEREGNDIRIALTRNVPAEVSCAAVITPYTYEIVLEDLTSGEEYAIVINGEEVTSFTAE